MAGIERHLPVCRASVEALHDQREESFLEELMDDVTACRRRLLEVADERLAVSVDGERVSVRQAGKCAMSRFT